MLLSLQSNKSLYFLLILAGCLKNGVLAAVRQNGLALWYARGWVFVDLTKNKEVVLAAVGQNGLALWYARGLFFVDLTNNKEVVLAAVGQNGMALKHASVALRGDSDAAFIAKQ